MNAILVLLLGSATVAHVPCPARLAPYTALLRVTTATGAFEEYEILDRAGARGGGWRISHVAVPADPAPGFDIDRCLVDGGTLTPVVQQFRAGDRSAALRRDGASLVLELEDARRSIDAEGVYGDWSCLVPLLMALSLREGASFEARVASPALAAQAQAEPTVQRFEVGAAQTLAMPWGEERAWPVVQRGEGSSTQRHWLRDRLPHVRLRVEFVGQPGLGATTLAIHEPAGVSSAADCPAPIAP